MKMKFIRKKRMMISIKRNHQEEEVEGDLLWENQMKVLWILMTIKIIHSFKMWKTEKMKANLKMQNQHNKILMNNYIKIRLKVMKLITWLRLQKMNFIKDLQSFQINKEKKYIQKWMKYKNIDLMILCLLDSMRKK